MSIRIKGQQARAAETRADILDAAERLWHARSFDEITISEIASEAGVAKGSVLAHFSEKLGILAHFFAAALDQHNQQLASEPDFASSAAQLSNALKPLLSYLLTDRALLRLLTTEGDGELCAAILNPSLERFRHTLSSGFAAAKIVDPGLYADVLIALVVHVVVSGQVHDADQAAIELERLAKILRPK